MPSRTSTSSVDQDKKLFCIGSVIQDLSFLIVVPVEEFCEDVGTVMVDYEALSLGTFAHLEITLTSRYLEQAWSHDAAL